MASDPELIERYVAPWQQAVADVVALLRALDAGEWSTPTDLPGWDVHAVAAHLAHIESELAGLSEPLTDVAVSAPGATTTVVAAYTEAGVRDRAGCRPDAIVDELERAAAARLEDLRAHPPTDPSGAPPRTPGGVAWDWATLLGNRVLDVWMHDQDIRRAVGRPGGTGTAAARHTCGTFARSFLYSVGKRVAPPDGTTVLLDVTGDQPVHLAVTMDHGRAVRLEDDPESPTVALSMDVDAFVMLAGGRRPPDQMMVGYSGHHDVAARILAAMAVTP
jgi:uncharacterized protein (TIGR03083 family)